MFKNNNGSKPQERRAAFIITAMLAAVVIFTIVKAAYDPVTQEQLKNLKVSLFDILTFAAAAITYFILKKRGRK